jgi:hypothetical protein
MSDSLLNTILIQEYLNSLTPKEYKAYMIAKSHLGTSFDIEKSIGYTQFVKNKPSHPIAVSPVPPLNNTQTHNTKGQE